MKIIMDEEQYEELEALVDMFDGMFSNNEEVECFNFMKKIVDQGIDTDLIEKERKERMKKQLIESFEFLDALNGYTEYKDKYFSFFSD